MYFPVHSNGISLVDLSRDGGFDDDKTPPLYIASSRKTWKTVIRKCANYLFPHIESSKWQFLLWICIGRWAYNVFIYVHIGKKPTDPKWFICKCFSLITRLYSCWLYCSRIGSLLYERMDASNLTASSVYKNVINQNVCWSMICTITINKIKMQFLLH